MNIINDPHCALYSAPGHPERPARILKTLDYLKSQKELAITWHEPLAPSDAQILRAHKKPLLDRVRQGADFDGDTPGYPQIDDHARQAVGAALHALKLAREKKPVFSLMRPPGHHATPDRAMGFCYFNSMAIAVLEAQASGMKKVAVFDFDVHHGNGTQDILMGRESILFTSVHQHPAYPGTGLESQKNCHNFPVAPNSPAAIYREACTKALEAIRAFKPDLLAVSAGFDAYKDDPLCQQRLDISDYRWLGEQVRNFAIPTFSLLEGGYSDRLPELIFAYLNGIAGSTPVGTISSPSPV